MAVAHGNDFLVQACLYFAAAVAAVMISHRLRLGSVAGYLLAGIAIGPWGFGLARCTTETSPRATWQCSLYEVHRNGPDST